MAIKAAPFSPKPSLCFENPPPLLQCISPARRCFRSLAGRSRALVAVLSPASSLSPARSSALEAVLSPAPFPTLVVVLAGTVPCSGSHSLAGTVPCCGGRSLVGTVPCSGGDSVPDRSNFTGYGS